MIPVTEENAEPDPLYVENPFESSSSPCMFVAELGKTYCRVTVSGRLLSPGAAPVGLLGVPHETLITLKPVVDVLAKVGMSSTDPTANRNRIENTSILDFKLSYLSLIHRVPANPVETIWQVSISIKTWKHMLMSDISVGSGNYNSLFPWTASFSSIRTAYRMLDPS